MSIKNAYGYIRVSTINQKEEGISLDTQTKRIEDYCKYKNYELHKVYSDAGISGGTMERQQLKDMLNNITKGNYIIVAELSRLSRNTKDALNILETIKNKGSYLISLNPDIDFSSSIGEMMYTILTAFHQLERKQTGERVTANMLNLSKQNLLRPRPPYGYKFISKEKPMEIDEEEQKIIKIIIDKYTKEKVNLLQISNYLNNNNYKNRKTKFYAQIIKNILADNGIIETKRKLIKNKFLGVRNNLKIK